MPAFRTPQRSIFLKIYVCFVLTAVLGFAAQFVIDRITSTGPFRDPRDHPIAQTLSFYGQVIVDAWMRGDTTAMDRAADQLKSVTQIDAYVINEQGRELRGKPVPDQLRTHAAQSLAGSAIKDPERMPPLLSAIVSAPSGRHVVVAQMPPPQFGPPPQPPSFHPVPRIMLVLIVTGIVCYLLARYLTAPIVALREATRRFSGGELNVRVGQNIGNRNDEFSGLSQDFDLMAERIERLLTTQRQLLGDISHELRTPLTRLNVALELARKKANPGLEHELGRIAQEAEALNELIGQVLSLSRMESGVDSAGMKTFDLAALVREIAANADFEARGTNRSVAVSAPKECIISGIPELIGRAVENIIRNAVHYTPEHTSVNVELHIMREDGEEGKEVKILIRDHGHGVPPQELAQLFRPFYRVSDARERETGGVGLGLSIAERAVRLHRGTLTAANLDSGGLQVTLTLPIQNAG